MSYKLGQDMVQFSNITKKSFLTVKLKLIYKSFVAFFSFLPPSGFILQHRYKLIFFPLPILAFY